MKLHWAAAKFSIMIIDFQLVRVFVVAASDGVFLLLQSGTVTWGKRDKPILVV